MLETEEKQQLKFLYHERVPECDICSIYVPVVAKLDLIMFTGENAMVNVYCVTCGSAFSLYSTAWGNISINLPVFKNYTHNVN